MVAVDLLHFSRHGYSKLSASDSDAIKTRFRDRTDARFELFLAIRSSMNRNFRLIPFLGKLGHNRSTSEKS